MVIMMAMNESASNSNWSLSC